MIIKYIPYQPHCFAFGGFEIQMLSTLNAVRESGVNASTLDVWSRDSNFDIVHCWGLGLGNYENVYWAKKSGKKVVITALVSYYENLYERFRYYASSLIDRAKFLKKMASFADAVVVLNERQATVCKQYFGVPNSKIFIIPNVVNEAYFSDRLHKFHQAKPGFVLTAGNICARKNQVSLAKACIHSGFHLVIIGQVLAGEKSYSEKLFNLCQNNPIITWIKGLPSGSEELIAAYQNCLLFALPSWKEEQPISALEAAATGKPLLLGNRAYATQNYYRNAALVNPASVDSIAEGLKRIAVNPNLFIPPKADINRCHSNYVGEAYLHVYKMVMCRE